VLHNRRWLSMLQLFAGISGKSQILFAIVYTTRYLDLFTTFISAYNTCMKIIFIAASFATVFLMYVKFKATYDHNHDTFRWVFDWCLLSHIWIYWWQIWLTHLLQDWIPDFTCIRTGAVDQSRAAISWGLMDIQHLSRISCDITTIILGVENRRGRKHHQSLSIRIGIL